MKSRNDCNAETMRAGRDARRRALRILAASLAAGATMYSRGASACSRWGCIGGDSTTAAAPAKTDNLVIDAHCHIFNADDIPIKGFLTRVMLHESRRQLIRPLNPMAQLVDWMSQGAAPGLNQEAKMIERALEGRDDLCHGYARGWQGRDGGGVDPNVGGLAYMTQPRIHNAMRMAELYPDVDLFVPALVDFEFWLEDDWPVPLYQQVNLLERISVMTEGRFHGYAPFDPARHAAARRSKAKITPLDLARNAVERQGFLGVKLYPPMGFKPWGNAESNASDRSEESVVQAQQFARERYDRERGPGRQADFRAGLDAALGELYDWCAKEDVPILAHCNDSSYADAKAGAEARFGSPEQWLEVLKANRRWAGLRVCLGHMLRLDLHYDTRQWLDAVEKSPVSDTRVNAFDAAWRQFVRDREEEQTIFDALSKGAGLFADLSNYTSFSDLKKRGDFRNRLGRWMEDPGRREVLRQKVMYGSDWHMHADDGGGYLESHRKTLDAERFPGYQGKNAARFLGLHDGGANRGRLAEFYRRWALKPPCWFEMARSA